MSHASFAVTAIATLALFAGCAVDNSGGSPPEGDSIAFAILEDGPDLFCGTFEDRADLLPDEAAIDAWLDRCEDENQDSRDDLIALQAGLGESESLVLLSVALGGCLGQVDVQGAFMDDDVARVWILKADSSYGRRNVACAADLGEQIIALSIDDEQASTEAEMQIGIYNPDLPNGPDFGVQWSPRGGRAVSTLDCAP